MSRTNYDALAREYVARGQHHTGIICALRRPVPELARRLLQILDTVTADEMRDLVLYV